MRRIKNPERYWDELADEPGIYVVQSLGNRKRFRIGCGGCKPGDGSLQARLDRHTGRTPVASDKRSETDKENPWRPVWALALDENDPHALKAKEELQKLLKERGFKFKTEPGRTLFFETRRRPTQVANIADRVQHSLRPKKRNWWPFGRPRLAS